MMPLRNKEGETIKTLKDNFLANVQRTTLNGLAYFITEKRKGREQIYYYSSNLG
jgi:hypothetical protein